MQVYAEAGLFFFVAAAAFARERERRWSARAVTVHAAPKRMHACLL